MRTYNCNYGGKLGIFPNDIIAMFQESKIKACGVKIITAKKYSVGLTSNPLGDFQQQEVYSTSLTQIVFSKCNILCS